MVILNVLSKLQRMVEGNYGTLKKKKIDETHYALWNTKLIEIFDVFKSHHSPVTTISRNTKDIEFIQGKLFVLSDN